MLLFIGSEGLSSLGGRRETRSTENMEEETKGKWNTYCTCTSSLLYSNRLLADML